MTKTDDQLALVKDDLKGHVTTFKNLLRDQMPITAFMTCAYKSISKSPKLLGCWQKKPESVLTALEGCAEYGLEPNTVKNHAYLVPYGDECKLVIGYQGFIQVLADAGYDYIDMCAVRDDDYFVVERGLSPDLKHIPKGSGEIKAFYAVACRGEVKNFEVMSVEEVNKVRDQSQAAKKGGPWSDWYEEMGKKTVLRRLCKRLPVSKIRKLEAIDFDKAPPLEAEARVVEPKQLTPKADPFKLTPSDEQLHVGADLHAAAEDAKTAEDRAAVSGNVLAAKDAKRITPAQADELLTLMRAK